MLSLETHFYHFDYQIKGDNIKKKWNFLEY